MSEVMPPLRALYRVDSQLIHLKKLLAAAVEEVAMLDRAVEQAEVERKRAADAIRDETLRLDATQLSARTAQAELADQDRKLKTVKNNVEYRIITDRVKELRQHIDASETELLQGMENLDRGKEKLDAAQAALAEVKARREARIQKAEADRATTRGQQRELKQRRDLLIEELRGIDEQAYALYDDALRRTKGDALGVLSEGVCQSCFMRQNPSVVNAVLSGVDLRNSRCGGCGRILRSVDDDA